MIETILTSIARVPLSIAIPGVLIVAVIISLIKNIIVRELYTYQELVGNNEVIGLKYGLLGEVFAVALGLSLVGSFTLYMGVRETSSVEVSALRSLYYSATERDETLGGKGTAIMRATVVSCSIPDDHISPRRSALFMARSVLRDILGEVRAC